MYGKNYVIEPKTTATAAVTANPAYSGSDPAKSAPASKAVVVEKVPVVQYIYSPASNTFITNRESGKYRTAVNSRNRQQARNSEQRSSRYNKGASTQTRKRDQASNRPAKNYSQPQRSSALKTVPHAVVKRPVRSKM